MVRFIFVCAATLLLSGCARVIEINQGRALTSEEFNSVKGLSTDEVRQLLGPPSSRWNLDGQVWVYYIRDDSVDQELELSADVIFGPDGLVEEVIVSE